MLMKTFFLAGLLLLSAGLKAQSIVGKWQLMKQSDCMEAGLTPSSPEEEEMMNEMKSRTNPTPQVIQFRENKTAEENTRIINKKKSYNSRLMLYKFTGSSLFILDKRSQTIIETFNVELLSADSLIISNTQRACETKVFVKIP